MSYVASQERVDAWTFKHKTPGCENPAFVYEGVYVDFITTEEFVKSVLPPGFDPVEKPAGLISISSWDGVTSGRFTCGIVSLYCKRDGQDGIYTILLTTSGDMVNFLGRQAWGECKKIGPSNLLHVGNKVTGCTQRNGTTLMDFEVDLGPDQGPREKSSVAFEVKAIPRADFSGLLEEPSVVAMSATNKELVVRTGKGRILIRGTLNDPLHTIPFISIGEFTYSTGHASWSVQSETPLGYKDPYWPYFVGKCYDDMRTYGPGPAFRDHTTDAEVDQHFVDDGRSFPVRSITST